jgi:hypothetical protein
VKKGELFSLEMAKSEFKKLMQGCSQNRTVFGQITRIKYAIIPIAKKSREVVAIVQQALTV